MIDLSEGSRSQFLPQVMYEGDKGVGVSYGAPLAMGDVNARWKAFLWSGVGLEAVLSVDHKFSEGIIFFADASYTWDGDHEEKRFRPSWGVDYEFEGWTGRLWWSLSENVKIEKDLGESFEGLIDRSPEFTLFSPWWPLPGTLGRWRLMGTWGDYEVSSGGGTVKSGATRLGLGAAYEGETKFGGVDPFWGAEYWWYDYGSPCGSQKVMTVRLGLSWPLGPVTMTSLWRKRWVEGGSPMAWDDLSDSEAFYQKAEIPFGEHWSLAVRGGYNLRDSSLDEMYYRLSYDSKCCFRVDLVYRDDRVGDDDWAGLVLVLNAFPSHPFFLGAREAGEYNP